MAEKIGAPERKPHQIKPGTAPGQGARPGAGAMGQPPFVPTDAQRTQVRRMVACGFTHESISVITSIPVNTLERHFPHELQHGKLISDARILTGIVSQAEEGDKTMSIFWAKARAGWRDVGKDVDGTTQTVFSINISNGSAPPTIDAEPEEERRITVRMLPEPEREP